MIEENPSWHIAFECNERIEGCGKIAVDSVFPGNVGKNLRIRGAFREFRGIEEAGVAVVIEKSQKTIATGYLPAASGECVISAGDKNPPHIEHHQAWRIGIRVL